MNYQQARPRKTILCRRHLAIEVLAWISELRNTVRHSPVTFRLHRRIHRRAIRPCEFEIVR
jgi:hypothetical protein